MELLTHPFTIGLGIGLLVAVVFWFNGIAQRRGLAREVKNLRDHLNRQMEITSKGTDAQKKELEELRKQNENLRVTNATLKQKPGRAEIQTLTIYDRALHIMNGRAPGFGPAWENALKEAESEVQSADNGIIPMIRKVFRPSLGQGGNAQHQIESGSSFPDNRDDESESKSMSRERSS